MSATGGPGGRRAVDASMSLLNEVMYRPVEPEYAAAAARQDVPEAPVVRRVRTALTLVMALVLGVVTVSAVDSLRAPTPAVRDGRLLLEAQIQERTDQAEALAGRNEELGAEIAALQAEALARADPGLAEQLARFEVLSGAVALRGPGLVVTLDDPDVAEGEELQPGARVQDQDLKIVTNGLWAAGAEAITINDERLTTLSAIRSAGSAILVDVAPLIPPYRIEALGDVRTMQTSFARSAAGNHLSMLEGTYGVSTSIDAVSELELRPASGTTLRFAEAVDRVAAPGSSPSPDQGGSP